MSDTAATPSTPATPPTSGTPATLVTPSARAAALRSSVIRDLLRLTRRPDVRSLAGGLPASEAIPVEDLRDAAARIGVDALQYAMTEGLPELRAWIAAWLGDARGRAVDPEHVVTVSGSQQALHLLGSALLDPGDLVAIEQPGYLGAIQALEACGAAFLPVPMDRDGMAVDVLEQRLRAGARPKLCYTVPTFQNPTGATMTAERRAALARLAERYGFLIVEDDPYGHLRFRGRPLAPVAAGSDHVVSVGTFSKILAPGLRVGWAAGPEPVIALLVRMKQAADLQAGTLAQALAHDLVSRPGWLDAHLRRIVPIYAQRCAALADALDAALPGALDVARPDGGMFLWARLTAPGADAAELFTRAVARGVAFVPGDAFSVDPAGASGANADPVLAASLRLSFATLPPAALAEAAERLAGAVAP